MTRDDPRLPTWFCRTGPAGTPSLVIHARWRVHSLFVIQRRSFRSPPTSAKPPVVGHKTKRLSVTTKEKAISLIQTLDDDASLDDVIDRPYLLRKIELGIAQADAGDVMEHDAFMHELEAEDAQQ